MGQLTQDKQLLERIDNPLDYLLRTWKYMPPEAEDWKAQDDFTRLEHERDRGVPHGRLAQLRDGAKQGIPTTSQQGLYQDAEKQPALDHMLAE
jgi:hypothetical protein